MFTSKDGKEKHIHSYREGIISLRFQQGVLGEGEGETGITVKHVCSLKGCTHRATEALRLQISMHQKGLSICGYTSPLRFLLFSI